MLLFFFLPSPGTPALSGTGTVTVMVDDVNDNVPVFTSSVFHTTIMEDAPTGTDVLLVNSSDADVGVNGVIRYSFSFSVVYSNQTPNLLQSVGPLVCCRYSDHSKWEMALLNRIHKMKPLKHIQIVEV